MAALAILTTMIVPIKLPTKRIMQVISMDKSSNARTTFICSGMICAVSLFSSERIGWVAIVLVVARRHRWIAQARARRQRPCGNSSFWYTPADAGRVEQQPHPPIGIWLVLIAWAKLHPSPRQNETTQQAVKPMHQACRHSQVHRVAAIRQSSTA